MSMVVGLPGIGGTLGECQLCGETFAVEIIKNEPIPTGSVGGIVQPVAVHQRCKDRLEAGGSWEDMPDGPLRKIMLGAIESRDRN